MIYQTGSVNLISGSNTVTGVDTEFLKYVSVGGYFKKLGDKEIYTIIDISLNTSLTISPAYKGLDANVVDYAITLDQTPNLGLPLINPNDPDASAMVNNSLLILDRQAGNFLDFQALRAVEYSGEDGFFVRGNYYSSELVEGRVLKFLDGSGELVATDLIENNDIFQCAINTTPETAIISYDNQTSGEHLVNQWDVLYNINKNNYVFVESINILSGELTYSGEFKGNVTAWADNDTLRVYSSTLDLAQVGALSSSSVPISSASGETLDVTQFKNGDILYNYDRGTSRVITSGETNILLTEDSADTWLEDDIVYVVRMDVKTQLANLDATISTVQYGAKSQIAINSVKEEHIDFGFGDNQVDGTKVPITVAGISGEDVTAALAENYGSITAHINSGENAHAGTAISFIDDGLIAGEVIIAEEITGALNELKGRVNASALISGVVDSAVDDWHFNDLSFVEYDEGFFNNASGEWYCRFDAGVNAGELKILSSFSAGSGEFTFTSGEAFSNTPQEGDPFLFFLVTTPGGVAGGGSGEVTSVFGRSGSVVAVGDDYTWAQIDKAVSDIADITTKDHASLSSVGSIAHDQIDVHIADDSKHHTINDSGEAATDLWSAEKISGEVASGPAGSVASVFGRSGTVVAVGDDYTWAQIDKAVSDIADITTKDHVSLSSVGSNPHDQIDVHIADASKHHTINDSGEAATDLWSAEKISGEIAAPHASTHILGGGDPLNHDNLVGFVSGEHFLESSINHASIIVAADNSDHDDRYYTESEISSVVSGEGASLVNIDDAGLYYAGTDAEIALQEIGSGITTKVNHPLRSEWLHNGFPAVTDVSLLWSDAAPDRTLTISPSGENFTYHHRGILYTETGSLTTQIADEDGFWVIYIDGEGSLTNIKNPSHAQIDSITEDECFVSYVYWDATNNDGRLLYELHRSRMSDVTHHWAHDNIGSSYKSGMALADFVIDDTGADDEDAQFSVATGEFYDEDIAHVLSAIGSTAGLEIWYLDGSNWRWTTNAGFSVLTFAGGSNLLAWNDSGSQTEVISNRYLLCHIFATNVVSDDGTSPKYIAIQGQTEYITSTAARTGAETEINNLVFGTLPLEEIVPVGTIIFQTKITYSNSVQARTVSTDAGDNYIDWRSSSIKATGGSISDHGSQSGLADDDHPGHPWLLGRTGGQTLGGSDTVAEDLTLKDNTVDNNTITVTELIASKTHVDGDGSDHADVASNTAARHTESHVIASHSDTTATGTQLNELTTSGETSLHSHAGGGGAVASVFGRSGEVVAVSNDYTWAEIDKAVSDIADITTKDHASLSSVGSNPHDQIDVHIVDASKHHTINDSGEAATDLWSAEKISGEVAAASLLIDDFIQITSGDTVISAVEMSGLSHVRLNTDSGNIVITEIEDPGVAVKEITFIGTDDTNFPTIADSGETTANVTLFAPASLDMKAGCILTLLWIDSGGYWQETFSHIIS